LREEHVVLTARKCVRGVLPQREAVERIVANLEQPQKGLLALKKNKLVGQKKGRVTKPKKKDDPSLGVASAEKKRGGSYETTKGGSIFF